MKTMEILTDTEQNVGLVKTEHYAFAFPPDRLQLESGDQLGPVTLAYETYGTLNKDKSNAILVLHALSGDAHAAGFHARDSKPGWWDIMIGPGKAFDTDKYFVICSNVIGGCKGSTGPSSINPDTGRHYGTEFPLITIKDMVNAQKHLLDFFGIERLLSAAGGSMGGMQVLQWLVSYPERIRSAIPIATAFRHSPMQIALDEVGRQAVMADPNWRWYGGNYYGGPKPERGLAIARMVGHITYMSEHSMAEKFGRKLKNNKTPVKFNAEFEVEGYLRYRGDSFVKRFDANSYLYITKAMDNFDIANGAQLAGVLRGITAKLLVIAFKSDWLYPPSQSKELVRACKIAGIDATYCEIESTYGHDAFLLEIEQQTHLIKYFLKKVFHGDGVTYEYAI